MLDVLCGLVLDVLDVLNVLCGLVLDVLLDVLWTVLCDLVLAELLTVLCTTQHSQQLIHNV